MGNTTVINELLCFLQNAFNSYAKEEIESAIADFYNAEEVTTAKEILTSCAKSLSLEKEVAKCIPQR